MSELEAIVNDPCFDDEKNNFKGRIEIVELFPATTDVVSDQKEIDEDNLGEQSPKDITGCIEIHDIATGTNSGVSTDSGNTKKESPAKKKRKKVKSSCRKIRPDFQMKRGSVSNIDEMVQKIKNNLEKSLQLRFSKNFSMMR